MSHAPELSVLKPRPTAATTGTRSDATGQREDQDPHQAPFPPRPEDVIALVAYRTGTTADAIRGPRKTRALAAARALAMYLVRTLTDLSFSEIGAAFGDRDHSTVLNACAVVTERIKADQPYAAQVDALFSTLSTMNL